MSVSRAGLVVALVFFAASLTPSLLLRPWPVQGGVSGVAIALGYGLGAGGAWLWRFLGLPRLAARGAFLAMLAAALGLAAAFLWRLPEWQDGIRALMEMPPVESAHRLKVTGLALALATAIVLGCLLVAWLCRRAAAALAVVIPRPLAMLAGVALVVFTLVTLIDGYALKAGLRAADVGFAALDRATDDGVAPPTDALASGGPGSLIAWESIGRRGKNFVAGDPATADIAAFTGRPAKRPLRVYVGLNGGDTPQARATLALAGVERAGGFERAILIVAVPTGTGWMDPSGVDAVEYLHHGDTAIVATQYSYLPSWMTLLIDPDRSRREARALFEAIYGRWTTLPRDARPELYLFGLSLGALGSEASTDLIAMIGDPIQGAVWSGAPFPSTIRNALTDGREPGSPEWLPRVRDGSFARFSAQENALAIPGAEWGPLRIAYLQYASDPMAFFSFDLAWRRPDWLRGERGPDVSPDIRWFPLVTMLQVGADLLTATAVPLGYGHNYAPATYVDGWVAVTDPPGWGSDGLARLKAHLTP